MNVAVLLLAVLVVIFVVVLVTGRRIGPLALAAAPLEKVPPTHHVLSPSSCAASMRPAPA